MTAYFILTHTITDLETYRNEYIPMVLPFIAKYNGEIVVASPEAEPLLADSCYTVMHWV